MKLLIFLSLLLFTGTVLADISNKPIPLSDEDYVQVHDNAMDILSSSTCRDKFRNYLKSKGLSKAFAYTVDPRGYYGECQVSYQAILENAEKFALQSCNLRRNQSKYIKKFSPECKLFASNNKLLVSMADYGLKSPEDNLIVAAQRKSMPAIKKMLDGGADLSQTDKFGSTPLHKAAWDGRNDVVEYLISKGADIKLKENMGFDVLNIASQRGNVELFKLLLEKGADINTTAEKSRKKPVHYAAQKGHRKLIKILIGKNVDINEPDNFQITPLHHAVDNNKFKTVKLLVENGANVNAKSKTGKTPLDYAIRQKRSRIAGYLDSKGAVSTRYKKQ